MIILVMIVGNRKQAKSVRNLFIPRDAVAFFSHCLILLTKNMMLNIPAIITTATQIYRGSSAANRLARQYTAPIRRMTRIDSWNLIVLGVTTKIPSSAA